MNINKSETFLYGLLVLGAGLIAYNTYGTTPQENDTPPKQELIQKDENSHITPTVLAILQRYEEPKEPPSSPGCEERNIPTEEPSKEKLEEDSPENPYLTDRVLALVYDRPYREELSRKIFNRND